ncbi:MAG: [Lentisphaeria bacterium]|nr:[FeFe] hydrogenase H-cluster radical SAM maturase HydE [Lentisphaeria bacterium]
MDREELTSLLLHAEPEALFRAAYEVKLRTIGKRVSLRGLIEMGNLCSKDCLYCGIRKSNRNTARFQLDEDSVVRMAEWAYNAHYGSIAIQSGEIESEAHTALIERILLRIRDLSGGKLGVTLSLGEQTEEVFRRWREAGAHRYLLRIEESNPRLYAQLHPAGHDFARRATCLDLLRKLDYQVGSGVMIGLPGQTAEDLANNILFFAEKDLDMIGMGPWLPHPETPMGKDFADTPEFRKKQLDLGLRMIAVTRLYLHNVNIAATTALQTLAPDGRERGLLAGANVIMPNVTDTQYRANYQLYTGKPSLDENSDETRQKLQASIRAIGEEIIWDQRGDSPRYFQRKEQP